MTVDWSQIITVARANDFWFTLVVGGKMEGKLMNVYSYSKCSLANFTGSGVSLSSSDGLGVVPLELFEVVRGVLDLDCASESLHCSTSTSSSSSPSANRFIDAGPN
jgi:hypothetical protein